MSRVNWVEMEPQVSVETVENPERLATQETGMPMNAATMSSTGFNDLVRALRSNMRIKGLKDTSNTKNVIILLMSYNLHLDTCKTVINTEH